MLKHTFFVVMTFVLLGGSANAAEVSCNSWREDNVCEYGIIRGRIDKGDYEKVLNLYRSKHPALRRFRLESPGGNVDESLKIGRFFRKYMIEAAAPDRGDVPGSSIMGEDFSGTRKGKDCICASACALIWFWAPIRSGEVGLHRPRTDDPAFRALAPAEASVVYKGVLNTISIYLDEMEAPKRLIGTMVETGSAEIKLVHYISDGLQYAPSVMEWIDASCGSFTKEEAEARTLLQSKKLFRPPLNITESLLLKKLEEQKSKRDECQEHLISTHISRLAPP